MLVLEEQHDEEPNLQPVSGGLSLTLGLGEVDEATGDTGEAASDTCVVKVKGNTQERPGPSDDGPAAAQNARESLPHDRNMSVLALEFVLFGSFGIAQLVMSLAGNSLSLLGDATCMIMDTITYGMNLFAEGCKRRGISDRTRLKLEFFIPLISVLGLVGTSLYILNQAALVLRAGAPETVRANDKIMLIFSCVNLGIDIVSVFFFVRIKGFFGFETLDSGMEDSDEEARPSNTNMCSAYTHVLADTMRSVAVIAAAVVTMTVDSVNGDIADAWAAVTVSIIIFVSLLPLLRGLVEKYGQLRRRAGSGRGARD